ncbi:ATP-binding cassette domain-containing protein [Nostoc sp.]|uniref:ATP-binding cassette domain-containing protein n=1 Tax=Nostoc sp. TaxID=1180 RepID=UPI002FF74C86
MIELQNINYVRDGMNHPLQNIQLTVRQGELVYLKGENGEGKSTLIDFILGIREPDSGEVTVWGYPPGELKSRFLTGVILQKLNSPIRNAQLGSLIDLIESHYPEAQGRVTSIFKDFDFHPLRDKNKKCLLSVGEEKLLFIALAQAASPKLLILDEPMTPLRSQLNQKLFLLHSNPQHYRRLKLHQLSRLYKLPHLRQHLQHLPLMLRYLPYLLLPLIQVKN